MCISSQPIPDLGADPIQFFSGHRPGWIPVRQENNQDVGHDGGPFVCKICGRGFMVRSYLSRHMKLHSGNRPYKCHFCPMTFYRNDRLTTHENVHTGNRPYVCNVPGCQMQYSHQTSLNHHLKVSHGLFTNSRVENS